METQVREFSELRAKIHEIIFEADTFTGKLFDVVLLIFILASVAVVMLESVSAYSVDYKSIFVFLELTFTVFFTIEYLLRIYCTYDPKKYITSFFGVIDLLAILPSYLAFFFVGTHALMVVRALRLLRVFRIFKLANFLNQGRVMTSALLASRAKIMVFLLFILLVTVIFGSVMYLIEGDANPAFDSIPRAVYWAIVTLTTVGYGDIAPTTPFGQFIAAFIMIMGYAVIAVPTGIVSSEIIKHEKHKDTLTTQVCNYCSKEGHDKDADYCKYCGGELHR